MTDNVPSAVPALGTVTTHVVSAAVWAVLVAVGAPVVSSPFVWTGAVGFLIAVVVVVAIGVGVGGLIAWAFRRTQRAAVFGALGVLPAFALPVLTVGGPLPVPGLVVVTAIAAASALAVYTRPARIAAIVLVSASAAAGALVLGGALSRESTVMDAQRFGSETIPFVATTPGYERTAATATGIRGIALRYDSSDGRAFVVSTEPAPDSVMVTPGLQICEIPTVLTDPLAEPDVLVCTETPDGWVRESGTRRELAVLRGDEIIRVNAELSQETGQLSGILDGVERMPDSEYREMLAAR
jgi:hypothetical protein